MIILACAALWALLVVGAILFVRHAIAEDLRTRDLPNEELQPWYDLLPRDDDD